LAQASDKLDQLETESRAAQAYITTLESQSKKDDELIQSLKDRDQIRLDTIKALDTQIIALNQALALSEKAKTDAVTEAARQTKRAAKWKNLTKYAAALGLVLGAGAVLMIKK
jgi:hypothetical protein